MLRHNFWISTVLFVQLLNEYEKGVVAAHHVVEILHRLDVRVEATDQKQEQLTKLFHRAALEANK